MTPSTKTKKRERSPDPELLTRDEVMELFQIGEARMTEWIACGIEQHRYDWSRPNATMLFPRQSAIEFSRSYSLAMKILHHRETTIQIKANDGEEKGKKTTGRGDDSSEA